MLGILPTQKICFVSFRKSWGEKILVILPTRITKIKQNVHKAYMLAKMITYLLLLPVSKLCQYP